MNVGDYFRFEGRIHKIKDKEQCKIWNYYFKTFKKSNYKSSPQIIDLIEENDYIRIITDTDFRRIYNSYGKLVIYRGKELPIETFSNKFIGGIITHEQMEVIQYRVEE